MNIDKLSLAIPEFVKKKKANASYYDSLVRAHESINKLALVPESF